VTIYLTFGRDVPDSKSSDRAQTFSICSFEDEIFRVPFDRARGV